MAKGYYHRSFVILQPRDLKFNIKAEKPAAGYCKIEVRNDKCKMYFHVQDLKSRGAEQEGYDIFLVSAQEGISPQKIASIYVDQRGRGECSVEIDVNDVGRSGYSLDQFHGLAVVCNDHNDISYPLVGYANKRVELDWDGRIKRDIARFYNKSIRPTVESKKEGSWTRSVEDKKSDGPQREVPHSMENKKQKTIQDIIVALGPLLQSKKQEGETDDGKIQTEQAQGKEDLDVVKGLDGDREELKDDAMGVQEEKREEEATDVRAAESDGASEEPQDMPDAEGSGVDRGHVEGQTYALQEDMSQGNERKSDIQSSEPELVGRQTYWEKTKEYYTRLFETNRKVYPFVIEMGEVEWVEVPYVDDYGYYGYIAPQHVGRNYYYDHYIVGLVKEEGEVRYVAYGIPGPYGTMPFMFMQGFSRWVPSRYGFGMGYWLLYIDACTGEIAYPY